MKLSVIIVNYNVRYFLEQCLLSVKRAVVNSDAEIFVVDNNSDDGSVEMLQVKFPFVKIIDNQSNVGFSKANNRAIEQVTGEYILLLNPDTVVAEDSFEECIAFMDTNSKAGAVGVRMIDGRGNFLPESKRGLPTPSVAFYKTFGLAKLFPRSRVFGKYHLGFLDEHETSEVDVLSGAFMFLRKSALDKTGLLDEVFFMYGEDIDLSYRLQKAGFKNYYLPKTTIIHYKGESTRKGTLNYVTVFYKAMHIFVKKHFSGNWSGLFSVFISVAITFRGALTLLSNIFASSYLFIIDGLLSFTGIYLIKTYWENSIKYSDNYYPNQFLFIVVPAYILIWLTASFLSGSYDKPFKSSNVLRGVLFGTIAISVFYAFIPDEWRFSRAIILLGAGWTVFEMLGTRAVYHLVKLQDPLVENGELKRSIIAGVSDAVRAENILRKFGNADDVVAVNNLKVLKKMAAMHQSNEAIFCSRDFSFHNIIQYISTSANSVDYKILNETSDALIGSNSKDTAGDLYVAEKSYRLFKAENLRNKRMTDILLCLALLLLMPLNILLVKNFSGFLSNWLNVLTGAKTWVGFSATENLRLFPCSKSGVLTPCDALKEFDLSKQDKVEVELSYAKQYSVKRDIKLIFKNYSSLGK